MTRLSSEVTGFTLRKNFFLRSVDFFLKRIWLSKHIDLLTTNHCYQQLKSIFFVYIGNLLPTSKIPIFYHTLFNYKIITRIIPRVFAECRNNTWGNDCLETCGHCYNKVECNAANGDCPLTVGNPRCEAGYSGRDCMPREYIVVWVLH